MSNCIEGKVASVSESGDLITDIAVDALAKIPTDDSVRVAVGPHETVCIFPVNHSEPESTLIAVKGASGHLEIGIVGMNMSEMLGIRSGETVRVRW